MAIFNQRLSALVLALALSASNLAVCAGWLATPEARMACCAEGETCPMHKSDSHGSSRVLTQAEADSCCAASEPDSSSPSAPNFVLAAGFGLIESPGPVFVPETSRFDSRRSSVPDTASHVPKHVLLSVFLV